MIENESAAEVSAIDSIAGDGNALTAETDAKKPKRRKVVMVESTAQVLVRRKANDIVFGLRCKEDRLVGIILAQDGTDSRAVVKLLGDFVINTAHKYNVYTQKQIAAIDRARGENVSVSNFVHRKIAPADIDLMQEFFDTMLKNNANDHLTRTMRVGTIFVGLTMCIEFRTELTPAPQHVNRFSTQMLEKNVDTSAAAVAARASASLMV